MAAHGTDGHAPLRHPADSLAFLLSKAGALAAQRYAERLTDLDLQPRQVVILRAVAGADGRSQQRIAAQIGVPPSRMVALVDALERRGLVQRRPNPLDRRAHALHLTPLGRDVLEQALALLTEQDDELARTLAGQERAVLRELLGKLVEQQDLPRAGHPAVAWDEPPLR